MTRKRILILPLLIAMAGLLEAHEFWLLPDFSAKPGQKMRIVAHTGGHFPTGDSAVSLDRIVRFDVHGARGKSAVDAVRAGESATVAEAVITEPGTYIIAVELNPLPIKLEAQQFNEYLREEGLTSILDLRSRSKQEGAEGKELYAKFAKAIVHVGDKRDDTATRALGLKLEIVALKDPVYLHPGEKLPIRVLFNGRPLANAQVAAVRDNPSIAHKLEHDPDSVTRTNLQGVAMIPIHRPGSWLIRMVHMIPAGQGKEHDWESFFSTLTFQVPEKPDLP